MPTYVSMVNWYGDPETMPDDVRNAVTERNTVLRLNGLHSVALLPDEGACAAVIISSVADEYGARRLAEAILPQAIVRISTMRFDDDVEIPQDGDEAVSPPPPRRYLEAVLEAVVST